VIEKTIFTAMKKSVGGHGVGDGDGRGEHYNKTDHLSM